MSCIVHCFVTQATKDGRLALDLVSEVEANIISHSVVETQFWTRLLGVICVFM